VSVATTPSIDLPTAECALPDGRTLAYATAGDPDGAPVVVHHGTPGSRLFGALLVDAARDAGARLLVPDRPGYGRSDPPPDGWGWTDWVADYEAFLDAISTPRAAVLGFSGGGPFAVAAATSDRTTRAGLVGALVPPAEGVLAALARLPPLFRALFRGSDLFARLVGPAAVVGQYTDRDVPAPVEAAVAADFHEAHRRNTRATAREFRAAATSGIGTLRPAPPVCAWHGTRDGNVPLDHVRAFVDDAGGELRTLDADHLGALLDCRRDALAWLGRAP
jgi:pimeloyl-ACP methyl ester carboxylesterase